MPTSMLSTNSAVAAAQRILETIQDEAALAELIELGDPRAARLPTFTRQNIIRTQHVYKTWKQIGRQVLAMHPEVVDEVRVATSDAIPGEVLRALPYMNPLVVFTDPPTFGSWLGKDAPEAKMRLLGFLTFGTSLIAHNEPAMFDNEIKPATRVEQRVYATNSADAQRLGMSLVFEALDANDRVLDMEFDTVTIFFDRKQSMSETVDELLGRFHFAGGVRNEKEYRVARKWMRQVFSVVVGTLFYLCSTTLEAEKVPSKTVAKHTTRHITRKPMSLYKVGWTTGAALTRYRQARERANPTEMGDITHQQDPQHRRSHFKMQPCGKGKADRKLIFVSAYWTHRERLGEEGVNIARQVPRVNGKGSAAESVETAMGMVNVPNMEPADA